MTTASSPSPAPSARPALNPASAWPFPTGSRPEPETEGSRRTQKRRPAQKLSGPAWSFDPRTET
jgi:hypothetical protein